MLSCALAAWHSGVVSACGEMGRAIESSQGICMQGGSLKNVELFKNILKGVDSAT
jgi:hypothetical protein